jgi:hypothetical protein
MAIIVCIPMGLATTTYMHLMSDNTGQAQSILDKLHRYPYIRPRVKFKKHQRRRRICITYPKVLYTILKFMFIGYQAIAYTTNIVSDTDLDEVAFAYNNSIRFDTDSFPIKIDNCCTQTMSGYKTDFFPVQSPSSS